MRLMLRAITGTLNQAQDFLSLTLTECLIRTRPKRITVAIDGEIIKMSTPLHYRIHPGALKVFAPERVEDDDE